jgi:hypothetical protein
MKRKVREEPPVAETRDERSAAGASGDGLFDLVVEPRRTGARRIDGVSIGSLLGFDGEGRPLVDFPENRSGRPIVARTTVRPAPDDVGREAALLFENGDPHRPILIGFLEQQTFAPGSREEPTPKDVTLDGERIVLAAKQEIVLRCGKATITLTRAGKILIRGAYVSSRSSGVNRVKGGSVQIN